MERYPGSVFPMTLARAYCGAKPPFRSLTAATSASCRSPLSNQSATPECHAIVTLPPFSGHITMASWQVGRSPSVCEFQVELMTWNTRTAEF
jgi:hypothetical protein